MAGRATRQLQIFFFFSGYLREFYIADTVTLLDGVVYRRVPRNVDKTKKETAIAYSLPPIFVTVNDFGL